MCLASVMLVVGTKSVIALIFCLIGDIPSPDSKGLKYSLYFLKI